ARGPHARRTSCTLSVRPSGANDADGPLSSLARDRKKAGDGGALAGLARDLDDALVLLDDAVAEGEAEAEPTALRGEEGREELGAGRLGDALALVDHLHLGHAPEAPPEIRLGEERVHAEPRDEGEAAAPRHRLDGVPHEVVEDLHHAVLVH